MSVENERIEELLNEEESVVVDELKKQWGYSEEEPLVLLGRLRLLSLPNDNRKKFFRIERVMHPVREDVLLNPITANEVDVYIYNQDHLFSLETYDLKDRWVKFKPQLSVFKEREKHNDPFLLAVDAVDIDILVKSPKDISEASISTIEGQDYIEQWVIDMYREKNDERLFKAHQELKATLEEERVAEETLIGNLKSEFETLLEQCRASEDTLYSTKKKVKQVSSELEGLDETYIRKIKQWEHKLMSLKALIEDRTDMLLKLDLMTEDELNSVLGIQNKDYEPLKSYSFEEDFSNDMDAVIAYIQAYLYDKGIIYRRSVLQDFLALLISNDLIVLAGDSGSGKTHLVKSFAEAIGGEAVIIPVKPNWTSAEDLLGYYNPLENKYLSTPFLDAILEAGRNPNIPYLICLDEMNLARVEYYFADFLSLLEERGEAPEIPLYSNSESDLLAGEVKNFIALIDEAALQNGQEGLMSFLEILKDDAINRKLHELCGFSEGDSLLRYHTYLRRLMNSYLGIPSKLKLPKNIRIIGAINVDETTHYLSPKILDRAHIMRFSSPLLMDWEEVSLEIEESSLDLDRPVQIPEHLLYERSAYPHFDKDDSLVLILVALVKEYLAPLGIEFGLRTVRQALNYRNALHQFSNISDGVILNQIILHKILPKMMFDGNRPILGDNENGEVSRLDLLGAMLDEFKRLLDSEELEGYDSAITELSEMIENAKSNDGIVNYWAR